VSSEVLVPNTVAVVVMHLEHRMDVLVRFARQVPEYIADELSH
jgi:hypothetical protein